MQIIKFPYANRKSSAVDGSDIPFFGDDIGNIIMCVELTKEDIARMRDSGKVYILLPSFGDSPPAIGLASHNPFNPHEQSQKPNEESTKKDSPSDYQ